MKNRFNKGFTLIELLVVIAIIGILATVVLTSLNDARAKSKDAAVKQQMEQLRNLLAISYDETGNYSNVGWGYYPTQRQCDTFLTGTHNAEATEICNNILQNANFLTIDAVAKMYVGVCGIAGGCVSDVSQFYSFSVGLNSVNANYYFGSSGTSTGVWAGGIGGTQTP